MSEFILDKGTGEVADRFSGLDSFTQGYIEAMFFTETGSGDDGDMEHATVAEMAEETWIAIIEDCKAFQALAEADLEKAYDYAPADYDADRAGNDFWYTRNGHGTGFWDRGFGDLGTATVGGRLSRDAKMFGACDLYRGDDDLLYIS